MTREEFVKLGIDSVIYNKISNDVVVVTSAWSQDKKEVLDEEYLGCEGFDGTIRAGLRMGDYEQWEYVTDDIPDKVMLFIVKVKLLKLEVLDLLVKKTNRSIGQTKFLFNILGDLKLLIELEESIKVFHCYYCPGDYAECMYLIGKLRTWKSCGWVKSNFNLI